MLVGDVRLAMNVLGTPGTKEVIAQLPIDDSLQSKDNVFRPLLNVAKREGNSDLLDDLSENVLIGSNRRHNLKMALFAIIESKPTVINADDLKTLAAEISSRSFFHRIKIAQGKAAPDVLMYLLIAASCYIIPILVLKSSKPLIEQYAKLQDTDVSIAYAVDIRQKKFNASFGKILKMVKGVRSKVDPDRKKDDDIEEAKIDLLPAQDSTEEASAHVWRLLSKLKRTDIERYTEAELEAFKRFTDKFVDENVSLDKSIDGPTRLVLMLIEAERLVVRPSMLFVQWFGKMLIPVALAYYVLTILKAIVDTAVDIFNMSYLRQFFNSTLIVLSVAAVGNVCLGEKKSSVSITTAIAMCMGSLAMWRGHLFVPKM